MRRCLTSKKSSTTCWWPRPLAVRFPARISGLERIDESALLLTAVAEDRNPRVFPGQFFHLAIDPYHVGSHWPESRAFSILHSNGHGEYCFILSRTGAFVERMWREGELNKRIWLKGPYGELNLELEELPETSDIVFVAAGSGISPFPSLISHRVTSLRNEKASVSLFYSARSEALLTEAQFFRELAAKHPTTFNVELFVTRNLDSSAVAGVSLRRLRADDVLTRVRKALSTHLFLSGPNRFVSAIRDEWISGGLPMQNIHFDDWG